MGADPFDGCQVPAAWIRRARAALDDLPPQVRQVGALADRLAADVKLYWFMEGARKSGPRPRKRDVESMVSAIARLETFVEGLPADVEGERQAEDLRPAHMALPTMVVGAGSPRRQRFLNTLAELRAVLESELMKWFQPGTRPDVSRHRLEQLVARDLDDAGLLLTREREGVLALTLLTVYIAAGIRPPEIDSLRTTLRRLVP